MVVCADLPDGFTVRLDPAVRVLAGGQAYLGGSPLRLLRLAPAAVAMVRNQQVTVAGKASATLARTLLRAGVAHPTTTPLRTPEVTVVIPVRDNPAGVARLLAAVGPLPVVVVDDGSAQAFTTAAANVTVVRHETSRGPAAARNSGLAHARTALVAFLDSDVVPRPGWLGTLAAHFGDPMVALAAPRIVALGHRSGQVARYEAVRSSLDLGTHGGPVRASTPIAYVPSAAMLVRADVARAHGGFDETMHVAEDVDLCWRLERAGWNLRYEPAAEVAHEHRAQVRPWLARKAFYGTGAALLARRHHGQVPPMVMSVGTLASVLGVASGTKLGLLLAGVLQVRTVGKLRKTFAGLERPGVLAAQVAARGVAGGGWQVAAAVLRHYWPLSLVAALASGKVRRIVVVAALAEGAADWWLHPGADRPNLPSYILAKRADDLAYGAGLWFGALHARSVAALLPVLTR